MAKFNTNPGAGIEAADKGDLLGIESVLERVSFELVKQFVDYLEEKNISATGALSATITPILPIEFSKGKATIRIGADKYYDFIDQGVNGIEVKHGSDFNFKSKYPNRKMVKDLKGWMQARGIGTGETMTSHAYAIATNIKKKGIKPKDITNQVVTDKLLDAIEELFGNALEQAVDLYFKSLEDGNNRR